VVEVNAVHFRLNGRELITFQVLIDPAMLHPKDIQQEQSITPRAESNLSISIVIKNSI
jgi:hypothetical protein